jgi:heme/copper-type cytochrome/quinol oxidase subunit 3
MKLAIRHDVSDLPTHSSGPSNPLWWGTLTFVTIEGLGFVFAIATYLYLYTHNKSWPIGPQPGLLWPSLLVGLMLLSELPNFWLRRGSARHDIGRVRIGLMIMSAIGLAAIALRAFELTTLNIRWDTNAYGSILWFLIGLHTAHIVTDVVETLVITVLVFIGPVDLRRFAEVDDNQDYWDFVVISWLVIYLLIYWFPRWFEVAP